MVDTPPPAALDGRRRRLLFRANHRGTRENDLLIGGFVSARIATFTEAEVTALEAIMDIPDPAISFWLVGGGGLPPGGDVALLTAMRDAAAQRAQSGNGG